LRSGEETVCLGLRTMGGGDGGRKGRRGARVRGKRGRFARK